MHLQFTGNERKYVELYQPLGLPAYGMHVLCLPSGGAMVTQRERDNLNYGATDYIQVWGVYESPASALPEYLHKVACWQEKSGSVSAFGLLDDTGECQPLALCQECALKIALAGGNVIPFYDSPNAWTCDDCHTLIE